MRHDFELNSKTEKDKKESEHARTDFIGENHKRKGSEHVIKKVGKFKGKNSYLEATRKRRGTEDECKHISSQQGGLV